MRVNSKFLIDWMKPSIENNKQFVMQTYPNAIFMNGFIYNGWDKLTDARWDICGMQAEYYAWLWARSVLENKFMEILSQ